MHHTTNLNQNVQPETSLSSSYCLSICLLLDVCSYCCCPIHISIEWCPPSLSILLRRSLTQYCLSFYYYYYHLNNQIIIRSWTELLFLLYLQSSFFFHYFWILYWDSLSLTENKVGCLFQMNNVLIFS